MEIYHAIRETVGPSYPVGIKLNSSDFLKDGFSEDESADVVATLAQEGIDLVEISGGTYEKPAMAGRIRAVQSSESEAYFLAYAEKVRKNVAIPLMVTGGFRTGAGMAETVKKNGIDLVGLARPLAIDPDLPNKILSGADYVSAVKPLMTGLSFVDRLPLLEVTWYEQQLALMADGKVPQPNRNVWLSLGQTIIENGLEIFRKRRA